MRPHSPAEAAAVLDTVHDWQDIFLSVLGRRVAFAADEYYLLAGRSFPAADTYEGFAQHEDGIGMARSFELELLGHTDEPVGVTPGFFAWVDGAPPEGYRSPRASAATGSTTGGPVTILTGELGAQVLEPLLGSLGRGDVRLLPVANRFFGGNIGVTGLLVGEDIARTLRDEADTADAVRYLLPDVCLSGGRFLDGLTVADLPRRVEVVPTDGVALRRAISSGP